MISGLLWFDNDPGRELAAKAGDAAGRFREKFGTLPTVCYVNPGALSEAVSVPLANLQGRTLRLAPAANILPHHFWIGVEEGQTATD